MTASTAASVSDDPAAGRDADRGFPSEWLLIALIIALLIPSRLGVPQLGALGNMSVLFGLGLLLVWFVALVRRGTIAGTAQPMRWVVGFFFLTQALAFLAGEARGLPGVEASGANRAMLTLLAMMGVALAFMDTIRTWRWLRIIVCTLVGFAAIQGVMGIMGFYLRLDFNSLISIPGLAPNGELQGIATRGGETINRVVGTTRHYIEFGVVVAMLIPLALHVALYARSRVGIILSWISVLVLLIAVPMSVSRSGLVTAAVAIITLAAVWRWDMKLRLAIAALIGMVVYPVISPGVLGTLRSLFSQGENDPSVAARTEDYEYVFPLIYDRPVFGRGLGTFLPERYVILDNEFLGTAVSTGVVGVIGLFTLFLGTYLVGRSVRRRAKLDEHRHLGQALAASALSAMAASFLFDSFSFPTLLVMVFIVAGLTGALYRISGVSRGDPPHSAFTEGDRVLPPLLGDLMTGYLTPAKGRIPYRGSRAG